MWTTVDTGDGDLARAIAAGEAGIAEAAEAELYRRFAPRVRLYGVRHLRDEDAARDLVQQVLLVTIEKLREDAVRDVDQIASFILGTSRTMVQDFKRREWRREKLRQTFMAPNLFEMPAGDLELDIEQLERCLAGLGTRDRLVVLLTFYAEKTTADVAREMGLASGNVRVIRHRAVERLRTCMTSLEGAS
jgi:RNA polymerase sigma-70 factor (ECF subfamily)